jgi:allantoinase
LLLDSDAYDDDLPWWSMQDQPSETADGPESHEKTPHLVIPYTLTHNDMRYVTDSFIDARDLTQYLKDNLK